jgi:cysteinyl-tRNA synthetase
MIDIIEELIRKNHAYQVAGDVYFSVESFKDYGYLSGKNLDDLQSGARVEVNAQKRSPLDFALWKATKPDEPYWDSPWGKGRPGWHIECSAMSMQHLGETIDIHGGGKDLVFPHHENEQAQSEAANGKPFVRYWIHNGFVNLDKEKMSKSLGNIKTLREILDERTKTGLQKYPAAAIRYALLSSHYRKPIDFSYELLDESKAALARLDDFLALQTDQGQWSYVDVSKSDQVRAYLDAMNDDFNTPKAFAVIFDAVKKGYQFVQSRDFKSAQTMASVAHHVASELGVIGGQSPSDAVVDSQAVEELIAKRNLMRANKDFAGADNMRQTIEEMGIEIKDLPGGKTTWKIASK